MYRRIYITLLLMIAGFTAQAQFHFGVKGGVNQNDLDIYFEGDKIENHTPYKLRYGGHAGVFSTFDLSDKFFLNAELLYSNKGNTPVNWQTGEHFDLQLNYMNLPVLAGYKPLSRLSIMLGAEVGYLLNSKNLGQLKESIFANDFQANPFECSLVSNVRFRLIQNLNLDIRYAHGITPAVREIYFSTHNGVAEKSHTLSYFNRSFQLALAYRIK